MWYKDPLVQRFLKYTAISSQSNSEETMLPSSPGQMELAEVLKKELEKMNLSDIKLTENAILTARLKGTNTSFPTVGFITHLDTFDGGFSPDVKAQIKKFTGSDMLLNEKENIFLTIEENPEILKYLDEDILVTDGTSVLGADDKAAVAVVMMSLEYLIKEKPEHGDIVVAFVPDEEIGLRGAKALNLDDFKADFAYTLDCCELGEVTCDNINSASCIVNIEGVVAHSMSTKSDRLNPILVAVDLINRMKTNDNPNEREAVFSLREFSGGVRNSRVRVAIGSFDKVEFQQQKDLMTQHLKDLQALYPKAKISYEIFDNFLNMKDGIGDKTHSVDLIYSCMEKLNITPKTISMRGGTDGSDISNRGIPTPNYFTGAHNFHSNFEFLPISSFIKAFELTVEIIKNANQNINKKG